MNLLILILRKKPLRLWLRIREILLTGAGLYQKLLHLGANKDFDRLRQCRMESVGDIYQRYIVAAGISRADERILAMDFIDTNRFAA